MHALLTLLENALDATFDTLELYCLRHVFGITPRQAALITLPHHRGLDLRPASSRTASDHAAQDKHPSAKGKRKSSTSTSRASEPSRDVGISAREESELLAQQERSLRRKITAVSFWSRVWHHPRFGPGLSAQAHRGPPPPLLTHRHEQ